MTPWFMGAMVGVGMWLAVIVAMRGAVALTAYLDNRGDSDD